MKTEITYETLKELLIKRYTNEQLSAYFNCGITTIKRAKKELGLVGFKDNKKPLSNDQLNCVQSLTEQGKSLNEISKLSGISDYCIRQYCPKELYTRILLNSRQVFTQNKVKADISNIFITNEESAYICGILQSDGSLSTDGYIGLSSIDRELVTHFARFFKTTTHTQNTLTSAGNTVYYAKFKDVRNIEKFKQVTNIYPQKTYTEYKIPEWILSNPIFMRAFIVGVFNGDGSVTRPAGRNTCEIHIEQHVSQKAFLQTINTYLNWGEYFTNTNKYFRIQTKTINIVKDFIEFYCSSEYALIRKVEVLESVFL